MRLAPAALVAAALACSQPEGRPVLEILRVSTHFGLADMAPGRMQSATAHLQDLVYTRLGRAFRTLAVDGRTVVACPATDETAGAIRHPDVVAVRRTGDCVEIALATAQAAADWTAELAVVDTGPYVREAWELDRRLVLRRRAGGAAGPARIELRNVTTEEEEWRLLLGGEVDLVPFVRASHVARLAEVPSIRVVPIPDPMRVALVVRADEGGVPVPLRAAISLAIRREALVAVAEGPATVVPAEEDRARARAILASLPAPVVVKLVLHDGATELHRVALVLQQQLATVGIDVEIAALSIDELAALPARGGYDLFLFFSGPVDGPRSWYRLLSWHPGNFGRYASPELDAAVSAGDVARVVAIVARDLPVIPLYDFHPVVAVDRSLCDVRPERIDDLTWLAGVRRCGPGERE